MYFNVMDEDQLKARNRAYVAKSRAKQTKERKKEINRYYLNNMRSFITRKVHCSISEDKIKHRKYGISPDQVRELYQTNKCCLISGVKLTHNQSLFDLSIDRIDNNLGHLLSNIQLVCRGINLAKNKSTNIDVIDFVAYLRRIKDAPESAFISRDYISSCIRNHKSKDLRRFNVVSNIDTDFIINMFNQQSGKCALTGVMMYCNKHPCTSISIDRIDNQKPHMRNNVRLVLKAINRVKSDKSDRELLEWVEAVRSNG